MEWVVPNRFPPFSPPVDVEKAFLRIPHQTDAREATTPSLSRSLLSALNDVPKDVTIRIDHSAGRWGARSPGKVMISGAAILINVRPNNETDKPSHRVEFGQAS